MWKIIIIPELPANYMNMLDIAFKAATVCIAGFNLFFAMKIFRLKDKKDETEKERDRKIQLLKTLVLDNNLKNYHAIFESIEAKLCLLKQSVLPIDTKRDIEIQITDLFIQLRGKFYDALLAIDDNLYENIKSKADSLQTHLTETIFDNGINLSHQPKYDEVITQKMTSTKTEIIKTLFKYRG